MDTYDATKKARCVMKVNIYYGGRGLIDDPAIYVMDKVSKVLDELK